MVAWLPFPKRTSARRKNRPAARRDSWRRPALEALEARCLFSATPQAVLPLSPPGNPLTPALATDGLGVNIHFTDPQPGEMAMLAAGGFRWVRMDFFWHMTERQAGVYDFSAYDRLMNALAPYGIRAVFILDYGNTLYDSGFPPHTDAARQAFSRWVTAAVQHFRGRGIDWELWNEPNLTMFWQPMANVQDYIQLARVVGPAIHAVSPQETFVGPTTSGIDFSFLTPCFQGGLLNYFDAVSVHPYRNTGPETAAADYAQLRTLIDRYAPAGRVIPILSGEWGYSSAGRGEDSQGKLLPRQWLTNLANDIPLSIWYDWHDDGTNPTDPEHHFGTVSNTYYPGRNPVYDPKPAYTAAATLTTQLAGNTYSNRLSLTRTDDYALAFSDGASTRYVTWTASATAHAATVPLSPGSYEEFSHLGADLGTVVVGAAGLSLTLTDAPVYFSPLNVPPPAPVHLAATAGNSVVTLSWAAVSGALSYNVYRGFTSGGEGATPFATGVTSTAFTDTGLSNGTTYYYLVTAVNAFQEGNASNEGAATPQASAAFAAFINFSNNLREVPSGYVNDIGLAFGDRGNGFRFGWNQDNTADARDRDDPRAPDERYDSFIHMQKPDNPNASWRIALPNGTYSVHLAAGEVGDSFDAAYAIAVQGVVAVRGTPTPANKFFEGTVTVTVGNGLLTITDAAGSSNNKIDYVDIAQTAAAGVDLSGGFAGVGGLQLNGGAGVSGTRLRLADGALGETRSAFLTAPMNVQNFYTYFSFQLTNPAADGFTFTLQNVGPMALGEGGGGLGYRGIPRSVAIKWDLFDNAGEGPDSTGLYAGGADPSVPAIDLRGTGIDLHSGHVFDVYVGYDGSYLVVATADETTGAVAAQYYPIDLSAALGGPLAYAGFTAATGGLAATQDILDWGYVANGVSPPGGGGRTSDPGRPAAGLDTSAFFAAADLDWFAQPPGWLPGRKRGFYQNQEYPWAPPDEGGHAGASNFLGRGV